MKEQILGKDHPEYKRLQKLSKAWKVPFKDLMAQFEEAYVDVANQKIEGDQIRLAINNLVNERRKESAKANSDFTPKAKAIVISGFKMGETGLMDKAEIMRSQAKRYVEREGRKAAIDATLINENNEVLDQREKIYGRTNPKYLEPLPTKLKLQKRTLFGCWRANGDEKFKFGSFRTETNQLARAWGQIPSFTPAQSYGIIKSKPEDRRISVNSSAAEDTMSVFKAIKEDWDILGIIEDVFDGEFTEINDIPEHYKTFKDQWDSYVIVRGVIAWVNVDRPTPWGAVWGCIIDPDLGDDPDYKVRIQIPEHVPVNFGEGSEVIVLGKTKQAKYRDDKNKLVDADVIIQVWGIYPIPGLTTKRDETTPEIEDEEEIEGWLE